MPLSTLRHYVQNRFYIYLNFKNYLIKSKYENKKLKINSFYKSNNVLKYSFKGDNRLKHF